ALTGPVGLAARMHDHWPRLAERCFKRSEALVGKLTNNPRPLGTVKDAAYAWRQMIFYLSVADAQTREQFVAWSAGELDGAVPDVQERLRPALNGLVHVVSGGAVQCRVGQVQPGGLHQDGRLDARHLLGEPDVFRQAQVPGHRARRSRSSLSRSSRRFARAVKSLSRRTRSTSAASDSTMRA